MNVISRTFENAAPAMMDRTIAPRDSSRPQASAREAIAIARIEVFDSFDEAAPLWAKIAKANWLATPFQDHGFLRSWYENIGRRDGEKPFIVAGFDSADALSVLLPFTLRASAGASVAGFAGGKHATFNMALWRPDVAARMTRPMLDGIVELIHQQRPEIDLLVLTQQPHYWNAARNPFALFGKQPSVNECPRLTIPDGAEPAQLVSNSFRRRLRGKERKLEKLGNYRHTIATSQPEVDRLLDAFFRYKPERMALQKLPNMFDDDGVQTFVRETCSSASEKGEPPIKLHGLECDDEVLAVFAGMADGSRFSMMYNTYTLSENARHSPGLILIRCIIDHYAALGYRTVDLGAGTADYKVLFCKTDENLFDSFVPLNARGRVVGTGLAMAHRAKRWTKRHPRLLAFLRAIERRVCRTLHPDRCADASRGA